MEESKFSLWARRIGAGVFLGLLLGFLIGAFRGSTVIANDLLTPQPRPAGQAVEIELVGAGRIVLPRSELTEREGVWGVSSDTGAYGQMAAVISVDAETVERSFRTLTGRFIAGETVTFDAYAAGSDPMEAFGMEFAEVRVPGPLGVHPAWFIDGERDTWVIVIHGEGLDERRQALRVLPPLADGGFPVLVITYRNDGAAPDDGGYYRWGLNEWQDVDAAIEYVHNRLPPGADPDFVLVGFGLGANIATMHLHESDFAADVRGAVLDSAVFDLGAVVDDIAAERNIPGLVKTGAKAVARIRFGLEWSDLDQLSRVDEFDVPLLILHGADDDVSPIETAQEFAAALSDIATFERFDEAQRMELWNRDPERYNQAVLSFLLRVASDGAG